MIPYSPFLLNDSPIDEQLTIHFHNYNAASGKNFIKDYDAVIRYKNTFFEMPAPRSYGAMVNFVTHYGEENLNSFLTTFQMRKVG